MPRVAVIGAGRWGRNLVRNLHELDALHSIADPAPDALTALERTVPEATRSRFATHVEAMASDAPAVAIATPSPSHFSIARDALEAGKDVFVEKPMAMTRTDAEILVERARARDRILMVGHLLLFQPAIDWMSGFIRAGRLGRVRRLHHERLQFGRPRAHENALWSLAVHDVAVALHLMGARPVDLDASGQIGPTGTEEDVHLDLAFADGAHAHVHASWAWPRRRRQLTVVGDEGILVYDELAQTVTLHEKRIQVVGDVDALGDAALACESGAVEPVFDGHGEPVRLELQHFIECVAERRRPRADGVSGLHVVDVLERAQRRLRAKR